MNHKDIALQEFKNRFYRYKEKNIAFYTRQFNPEPFFNQYPDYKFIGVMENYVNSGFAYGKEILSFERALELGVELIIIASDPVYYETIRSRIAGFCRANRIQLFTVDGVKLSLESNADTIQDIQDGNDYHFHADKGKREIDAHETILFGIYDTLVMRKISDDADFFECLSHKIRKTEGHQIDFSKIRMQCQQELKESGKCITLDAIYQLMQTKTSLSADGIKRWKDMELALGKELTIPRYEMLEVYHYAIHSKKKVFLVQDTCLPRTEIEKVLAKFKITGYEEMLLTSEETMEDMSRRILQCLDNQHSVYIGNGETKGCISEKITIDICQILSAAEMMKRSVYRDMRTDSWYARIKCGLFAAKIFNSPFALYQAKGRGRVSDTEDISYLFLAPLVMDFMVWFMKSMQEDGIDLVLFGARDGYVPEKLYRLLKEKWELTDAPHGVYFLSSRLLCTIAGMVTEEDFRESLKKPFIGDPRRLLKERYLLNEDEIIPYEEGNYEDVWHYITSHAQRILKKAAKVREQYQLYGNNCGLDQHQKIAFFDFVASGSCQNSLEKLFGKDLYGYYFSRLFSQEKEKALLKIKSWAGQSARIEENALFMECIFTSPQPGAAGFDEAGNPVFTRETRSKENIEFCLQLQKGVFDYVSQMAELLVGLEEIDTGQTEEEMLDYLYPDFTVIDNERFHQYEFTDEFIGCKSHVGRLYRY